MNKILLRLVAAAAILAPGATYAAQAPARAADVPVTTAVRVATYNVQVRRTIDEFRGGVIPLLDRSDIIGLQEMESREKEAVLASLTDSGWSHVAIRPAFQMPVLWRHDRFTLVSARTAQISPVFDIGNDHPRLAPIQKSRHATVVRLLDKVTGRNVSVINVHLIHGAVRGGKPWVGRPRLFELYKRQLVTLAAITNAEKQWGQPFVLGDFNAGWVADRKYLRKRLPIRTYGRLGMTSMWAWSRPTNGLGTRNDALIDQIWSGLTPASAQVQFDLSGFSDHRPAIAVYPTT